MAIYTYKITNTVNGKYYIGIHRGEVNDQYMGSGVAIKNAIKKYGKCNFKKKILKIHASIEEAWLHEKELVTEEVVNDPLCYNMHKGGRGGWDHIDIRGKNNPMHRPEVAKKVSDAQKIIRKDNERLANISRENAKNGGLKTKGRKRPEHSEFMKDFAIKQWKDESFRKKISEVKSNKFTLISPDGIIYENIFLSEYCERFNLPFTTLWNSAQQNGKKITKGKAKNWICKQIN